MNVVKDLSLVDLDYRGISISCPIAEGHRMVPVKTVCQIIDVDFPTQDSWLKKHKMFSQLYSLDYTTGADGKQYEMRCLPMFDLFAWLTSISQNKRRSGSIDKQFAFMAWLRQEMLTMYKLIELFEEENKYELDLITQKSETVDQIMAKNDELKNLKSSLKKIDASLAEVREKRFTGQTALSFPQN